MAKEIGKDMNAQEDAAKVKYTFRDIYDDVPPQDLWDNPNYISTRGEESIGKSPSLHSCVLMHNYVYTNFFTSVLYYCLFCVI